MFDDLMVGAVILIAAVLIFVLASALVYGVGFLTDTISKIGGKK